MKKLIKKLPNTPGVYLFRGKKRRTLYIGKATSLRTRVASYFRRDLIETRGPIITGMVEAAQSVDFLPTDSVLEALILEAALIKKHQPPYNTKEKSDKSFNYVVITDEEYPRVITMRDRNLVVGVPSGIKDAFGPFPQGGVLREALAITRKIFPFRDKCVPNSGKPCFNAQIGLCPGVCTGRISRREYTRTIQRVKFFFEGKKKTLIRGLERDMKVAAKNLKFEEASRTKKMLFALNHIQDVALLKADFSREPRTDIGNSGLRSVLGAARIEAYDVAHISGTNTVGVMVVVEEDEVKKSDYRKFKIRTGANNDVASLREMISRRFEHTEWPLPKLIVVDGGRAQVNAVDKVLKEWGVSIPVVGVVKDEHHRPKNILGDTALVRTYERPILLANSEAHRFAITYHRTLRGRVR